MTIPDRYDAWRKSSYSSQTDNCVEIAFSTMVGVRDTKDREGGHLALPSAAWRSFTESVKHA